MNLRQSMLALAGLCLLFACGTEDELKPTEISSYDRGIFVVNQGNTNQTDGSISFYHRGFNQSVADIYSKENPSPRLGNILQDIAIVGNRAFIPSAETNRLEVVNATTFRHLATIEGFARPKALLPVGTNKIYVSQWGADGYSGSVEVVDLSSLSIVKSIPTAGGAGKMVQNGPAVYVANSGGFGVDSVLTKIDGTSDLWLKTIEVGYSPVDVVADADGSVWALSAGVLINFDNPNGAENTPGALTKIVNDQVVTSIPLTAGARNLVVDQSGDKLYFVNNNWTYEHPVGASDLSLVPFLSFSFNAYAIDPATGYLVAANALDFNRPGEVHLYDLSTAGLVDTFHVGIAPIAFGFR